MVSALLDGRKTMTRRLAWREPDLIRPERKDALIKAGWRFRNQDIPSWKYFGDRPSPWQKVKPGDRLWVRETHARYHTVNHVRRSHGGAFDEVSDGLCGYRADGHDTIQDFREHIDLMGRGTGQEAVIIKDNKWLPSIHMPRWASRLTLVVTATKIEPLRSISAEDIRREGLVPACEDKNSLGADEELHSKWEDLWESLHGEGAYMAGGRQGVEVVALTFTVHHQNIDGMKAAA